MVLPGMPRQGPERAGARMPAAAAGRSSRPPPRTGRLPRGRVRHRSDRHDQALGVGIIVAVIVDATLMWALLVPAAMRLLGDWNWWTPAALTSRATLRH